jgi:hypothetical protein
MALTLNIAPITFDADQVTLGRLPYTSDEDYERLREIHRESHVLRFDRRDGAIVNVPVSRHEAPLGAVSVEPVGEHLLLLSKAMQHALVRWLKPRFLILSRARPVTFWGGNRQAKLLEQAVRAAGAAPRPDLDVRVRYTFDARLLPAFDPDHPQLGLIIDVGTSNVVEVPASELLGQGFRLEGCRVCRRPPSADEWYLPHLEVLGRVRQVRDGVLLLAEAKDAEEVPAADVMVEPTLPMLERVITQVYGRYSDRILKELKRLRGPYAQAPTKLQYIQKTLDTIREEFECRVADSLTVSFGSLLSESDDRFPPRVATERPSLLFGAQGTQTGQYPDVGIQKWGPYLYTQHVANEPLIAVLCEAPFRGRLETFVEMLRNGFPQAEWERATEGWRESPKNPFAGGLVGKFRLQRVHFEFEEVAGQTATAYREAAERLLNRLPSQPQLAIVQIRQHFRELPGATNPYYVVKAALMMAGVPVQAIHIENIEADRQQLAYLLNNFALASYAKMQGVPWLLSTRAPASHELVIGIGYSEVRGIRPGDRTRYVGLTTLFYGDGRYGLWGLTKEVAFDEYAAALLESLRVTIRFVRERHGWQRGDRVRLVFHVYKPLKYEEITAIRNLVASLLKDDFVVEYAFLDLSSFHRYYLFDPASSGKGSGLRKRGVGVPARGVALQLGPRAALLHLTGPSDLKTDQQGMPQPLLIELHEMSDFTDLVYLVRQVYAFSFVSWRSFFPGSEPVTMSYSRRIAHALGHLASIDGWDARQLAYGPLRQSQWFL